MPAKTGLQALLRPEDSILVLIDHQPYQFTNLNSHEPTMITNNVIALAKLAKVFNVPTILTSPTTWLCAAWSPPVQCRSTGLPCWANGSVTGHARKPQQASPASFSSTAVPALPPWPGSCSFSPGPLGRAAEGP